MWARIAAVREGRVIAVAFPGSYGILDGSGQYLPVNQAHSHLNVKCLLPNRRNILAALFGYFDPVVWRVG